MKHILDAGPLIAALNRNDRYHDWACETLARLGTPLHTCPEVLAEAAAMTGQPQAIVEMVEAGDLRLDFDLQDQSAAVLILLRKYRDRGMDLADACIVRMSELCRTCLVVTVDRTDFRVYRRNGRDTIPVLCPPQA
jgi:predicted nucleic acid-binding protein